MTSTGAKSGLRLARIVGDGVFREKILPEERLNSGLVSVIAGQMDNIVREMEAEWESEPASDELREAFRLLRRYVDCLRQYRKRSV